MNEKNISAPTDTNNEENIAAEGPSGQQSTPRVYVQIGVGVVNQTDRTISWPLTFSHSQLRGFTNFDIINKVPSGITVTATKSGTTGSVKFSGFSAGSSGTAGFTIRANAFTGSSLPSAQQTSYLNNIATDAPNRTYSFAATSRVTIQIGNASPNNSERSITWPLIFSHSQLRGFSRFDIADITPRGITVTATKSGTTGSVKFSGFAAGSSGTADFSIRATAFITSSLPAGYRNNAEVNAPAYTYTFLATPTTYTASWSGEQYYDSTRDLFAILTLPENPGTAFRVSDDLEVQKRSGSSGSYTWASSSSWTIAATSANQTDWYVGASPASTVTAGTYRLVLKEDAIGTDRPSADVASAPKEVRTFYTASWGAISNPPGTRNLFGILLLSETPGTGLLTTSDFKVQKQARSSDRSWADTTGWTINITGTGQIRFVAGISADSVTAGTYRIVFKENAVGTDKPNADVPSQSVTIPDLPVTVTISDAVPNVTNRTITWGVGWSHAGLTGFDASDIINRVPVGAIVNVTETGIPRASRVTFSGFSAGSSGTASFSVRANAFTSSSLPNNRGNNIQTNAPPYTYNFRSATQRVTVSIGNATINTTNRTISWPITLSHSGLTGFTRADITNAIPYAVGTALSGSGTSYTVTLSGFNQGTSGTAGFTIRANAFTASSLPTNYQNNIAVSSSRVPYSFPIITTPPPTPTLYTASWGTPSYTSSTRRITTVLTLSEDPGTTFSVSNDFKVQKRSGSSGSYTWADTTGWSFSFRGSTTSRTIIAFPATSVTAGTYRIVLKEDAFGTDKPSSDVVTSGVAVGAYVFVQRVSVTIGTGTVNTTNRTISWPVTLSHSTLTGFSASDIINRAPLGATVTTSGSGSSRTVTFSGFSVGDSGSADFSIRANAFDSSSLPTNFQNNVQAEANAVSYNFSSTTPPPPPVPVQRVTVSIGNATINTTNRTISWPITLSHSGLTGFTRADITNAIPYAVGTALSGSGTSYTVTLSGFNQGTSGTAGFTIRANAFTASSLPNNYQNNIAVSSSRVPYNFATDNTRRMSFRIGQGVVNTITRQVVWSVRPSQPIAFNQAQILSIIIMI